MSRDKTLARMATGALVVAGMLASATPAAAYRMIQNNSTGRVIDGNAVTCENSGGFAHWDDPDIRWYHNTAGQGSGKASALQAAMQAWTNVLSASHVLTYNGTTSSGWATDNRNTILWASGNGCTGNCLALTALVLQSGQVIVESDITFNADENWTTNGSDFDTQAVATHELGHTLGIHHTNVTSSPRPTMSMFYEDYGVGGRSLEWDDESALQCAERKYFACTIDPDCEDDCWGEWASCWDPGLDAYCNALYDECIAQCPCN